MSPSQPQPLARALASAGIAGALTLQLLAAFNVFGSGGLGRSAAYPFVDYALFREPHFEGDEICSWRIEARSYTGKTLHLDPLRPGPKGAGPVRDLVSSLLGREDSALLAWCRSLASCGGIRLRDLRLYELRYALESSGFRALPARHVQSVQVNRLATQAQWMHASAPQAK